MCRPVHFRALFLAVFLVFYSAPLFLNAQTVSTVSERAQMMAQINWLLEQIQLLQAEVATRDDRSPYTYSSNKSYEIVDTFYYGQDFEAIYEVNSSLNLIRRDKITSPRSLDTDLWEMFVSVIGEKAAANHIREFRVFNDKDSSLGGFVELPAGDKSWIVGFNRDDFEPGNEMSENIYKILMIHEYAHLITFYMNDFVTNFEKNFWTAEDRRHARLVAKLSDESADEEMEEYYENHQNDFVSDYATYNSDEDIAETFVPFVLEKKPLRNSTKEDAKILSMYADSRLVAVRNELRKNIGLD